ncbi:hypothetical protein OPV22_023417 [Ensete ventricosum]|uniref:Pectate lyase superfamily protein domain-containing protein n=1 Tax=Ensete ventricosum TaxID=4639 RepID=A0AAV8PCS4_ENSVE|nr:hypothetical protein OPV22_023417 [Ensete ventricosum]
MVPFRALVWVAALLPLLLQCSVAVTEVSCSEIVPMKLRREVISITDFGAVGDGRTLNTWPFKKAIYRIQHLRSRGGTLLYIPPGVWLTGSFSLTSHMTLYLARGAVIKATQDTWSWPLADPLPSYGRGRELPGRRYVSFIHGDGISDVIITGENGTIDGQGDVWWNMWRQRSLHFTRPNLLEFKNSRDIIISNVVFQNSPFWNIHPVYCSNVVIKYVTVLAPYDSPNTDGIDPDSSSNVCIEDAHIATGDDLVAIKSGGGYIRNVTVVNVSMNKVRKGIRIAGDVGDHPDEYFNRYAMPTVDGVTIKNVWGIDIQQPGSIEGIRSSPFTRICLSNVKLWSASMHYEPWKCMDVSGAALGVQPWPCSQLTGTFSAGFCSSAF